MASQSIPHLYQYQRLSPTTKVIRAIRLFPAETLESELCCNIFEVSLESDEITAYEAISYAWEGQSTNENHYITCVDGENTAHQARINITKNSSTALRHLRKTDDDRILWMDSICINQASTEDKNHQVRLMGDVYTRAKRVLIWLGEDRNSRIGPLFGVLRELAQSNFHKGSNAQHHDSSGEEEKPHEDDNDDDDDDDNDYNDAENRNDCSDRFSNSAKPLANKHHQRIEKRFILKMQEIFTVSHDDRHAEIYSWHLYTEIFRRPWFHRMWTLQEIALADPNTALVYCGRHQIEWGSLQKAVSRVGILGLDSRALVNAAMYLCLKLHLYLGRIQHDRYDIPSQLFHSSVKDVPLPQATSIFVDCRTRGCGDKRDMAFALHGVCSELKLELPQPDYGKSAAQVFTEVARAIITHDKSLDILYHVNSPRRNADLPSWVPDWSDHMKVEILNIRYKYSRFYEASSSSSAIDPFGQDSKGMMLLAKIVDKVASAGKLIPVIEEDPQPTLRSVLEPETQDYISRNCDVWKAFQSWTRMVSELAILPCRHAEHEAAWYMAMQSTLTADYNRGKTAKELMESSPEEFLEQAQGFASWYRSLNSQDLFEKELIERGAIQAPGELAEEQLTMLHIKLCLFMDGREQRRYFHHLVWACNRGKSFFVTNEGRMGTVEGAVQEGHIVAIVAGLSMPLVLERVGGDCYRLVGYAYVLGLMKGEEWPEDGKGLEKITLV